MKTNSKWISCILALIVIGTSAVWAQTPVSPQSEATAGLTATEVDQFMSVTDWGEVKFGKAFTFAGFSQDNTSTLDLGAAFKAGPVYIGSWYQGDWNFSATNTTKTETTLTKDSNAAISNITRKKTDKLEKFYETHHRGAMLLGFGNIGLKFGYGRFGTNKSGTFDGTYITNANGTITVTKQKEYTTTTHTNGISSGANIVYSPKGYFNQANHTPFIEFGMNVGLGKMTLSPTALLAVNVKQDSLYGLTTTTQKQSEKTYSELKEVKGFGKSYTSVIGNLGLGLSLGDSLDSAFSFGYDFDAKVYANTHTDAAGKKHKVKGVYTVDQDTVRKLFNTTVTTGTPPSTLGALGKNTTIKTFNATMTKKTFFSNTLSVGYSMKKDFTDRLAFLAGVDLPLTVQYTKDVEETKQQTTTTVHEIDPSKYHEGYVEVKTVTSPVKTVKDTTVTIAPELKAAMSYAALPGRLFLNLGTNVRLFGKNGYESSTKKTTYNSFVDKTHTQKTYNDGRTEETVLVKAVPAGTAPVPSRSTEESVKTNSFGKPEIELTGGLRWNIVENVGFDLVYKHNLLDTSAGAIDWTKLGKLKLACTIKF